MSDDDKSPHYMRLGDGTLIDVRTGKRVVNTEINKAFSDAPQSSILTQTKTQPSYEVGARRYLDDLPLPPTQSRAVAVVAAYKFFGLSDADIAHTLSTTTENVRAVCDSEAYSTFVDAILQNVREHDLDKVRKKINDAALTAANRITQMVDSRDEKIALTASKDVLDRAANGAYTADQGTGRQGSLTIRIIDDRENAMDKIKVDIDA